MVDSDILLLGAYYVVVILGYLLFEMMPINYRPILSILSVMIFIVTRQPYAGIICFAFLVVKSFLIAKGSRSHAA